MVDKIFKGEFQNITISSDEAKEVEEHLEKTNFLNHYVLYSKELENVVRDEFWRSINAVSMSMKALVSSSCDKMFLSNLDKYSVYKVGLMNRTTLSYQPLQVPELVFEDLTQFLPNWNSVVSEDDKLKATMDRLDLSEEKKQQILDMYKSLYKAKG